MQIKCEMLISIILPTYNGSAFLDDAIQSCLDQTYIDWELIIVDDASTDNTPEIINRYLKLDNRIHSIRHDFNRRLPESLNTGFEYSHGNFLTWTSDDNIYKPSALEILLFSLTSCPKTDFVYANYSIIDKNGRILRKCNVLPMSSLLVGNFIGPCFLYKRDVCTSIGEYRSECFLAEDYDYWLRTSTRFSMRIVNEDLYFYREHGSSLTSKKTKQIEISSLKVLRSNLPELSWADDDDKTRALLFLGEQLHKLGLATDSSVSFLEAMKLCNYHVQIKSNKFDVLIYKSGKLKEIQDLKQIMSIFPGEGKNIKRFKLELLGQYYGVAAFDSKVENKWVLLIKYWIKAVLYQPNWLRNFGFIKLLLYGIYRNLMSLLRID